ncbi:MAG: hypothetical protein QOI48_3188 [Solirubrobacteraceae bacterium]|nr:hypothetical protein [Solirubrobacteraceae bacterium]
MAARVALRSRTDEYVRAEGPGGELRVSVAGEPDAWEVFMLTDLGGGKVRLQASNGLYVCAEGGGGGLVTATRPSPAGTWETFRRETASDGRVSLRADNGKYLCAEGGGGDLLLANRDSVGDWERFTVVEKGDVTEIVRGEVKKVPGKSKVALRAGSGQFLRAEGGGGGRLVIHRQVRALGSFVLDDTTYPGSVMLRAANRRYVCAEGGGGGTVHANRDAVRGAWEKFGRTNASGSDKVWLRAADGPYLQVKDGKGPDVIANGQGAGDWETFHELSLLEGPRPGKLLVYYGWPSLINNAKGDLDAAARAFAYYEYVILGAGLEVIEHDDHANTVKVIERIAYLAGDATKMFGYIPLGKKVNYSLDEFGRRAGLWKGMKVHGIFIDEFGYDFMPDADRKTMRTRQNGAVDMVHELKLPVIANGWEPDDLFNSTDGSVSLGVDDYYFAESFQIAEDEKTKTTVVQPATQWRAKAVKLRGYQQTRGLRLLSTTTTATVKGGKDHDAVRFDPKWFDYAYYSALLDGHEAFGWGEPTFCASGPAQNSAPFRVRPSLSAKYFTDVVKEGPDTRPGTYERPSDVGTIFVKPGDQSVGTR